MDGSLAGGGGSVERGMGGLERGGSRGVMGPLEETRWQSWARGGAPGGPGGRRMTSFGARNISRLVRDHAPHGFVGDLHPDVTLISTRNAEWARRWGLVLDGATARREAAVRCGTFAAHTYPTADEELVQLGADLVSWLCLLDDLSGEGLPGEATTLRQHYADFEVILRSGRLPVEPPPFHRALLDLRHRALARADRRWLERFADAMASYFRGCELEHCYRLAGVSPHPREHRELRSSSIGAQLVFALIELHTGLLTPLERASPQLMELRKTGALLCAWLNDISSYPKMCVAEEPLNLVAALARQHSLTPQEALAAAIQVFRTDAAMLEALLDALRYQAAPPAVLDFAQGVERWVRGNSAWTGLRRRCLT